MTLVLEAQECKVYFDRDTAWTYNEDLEAFMSKSEAKSWCKTTQPPVPDAATMTTLSGLSKNCDAWVAEFKRAVPVHEL